MDGIKGLFFDVGGTVFDWKNTAQEQNRAGDFETLCRLLGV